MSENNKVNPLNGNFKIDSSSYENTYLLYFTGKDGRDLGNLKENQNGQLEFDGDATESARLFFDEVIKLNSMYIKKLEND